jgi:hypothetical protein
VGKGKKNWIRIRKGKRGHHIPEILFQSEGWVIRTSFAQSSTPSDRRRCNRRQLASTRVAEAVAHLPAPATGGVARLTARLGRVSPRRVDRRRHCFSRDPASVRSGTGRATGAPERLAAQSRPGGDQEEMTRKNELDEQSLAVFRCPNRCADHS